MRAGMPWTPPGDSGFCNHLAKFAHDANSLNLFPDEDKDGQIFLV